MSIAKFNERALLDLGMDRQTVAALRHILTQVGNEVGAKPLPQVASQTSVLDYRTTLQGDIITSSAADTIVVSMAVPKAFSAGGMMSGRILGVTSNGATAGTLNIWLSVDGVKVFNHAFTTPEVIGTNKGFGADFTLTAQASGGLAGGVLSLAYNAPTVLPAVTMTPFSMPSGEATFALGMNWTAAATSNVATAKIAYLSVEKL